MIIEIPNENSIVKWKNDEKDEWKYAEISDLIQAYERPKKEIVPVCKVTFDKEQLQEIVDKKVAEMIERPQGEWIEEGTEIGAFGIKYTWNKCNKCGWSSSLVIPKNFCPNCGADMRGKENDKLFYVEHTTKKEEDHETM